MLKYVQIQCANTVVMTIIHHFIQSRQETLWTVLAHYVPVKNLKKFKLYSSESLNMEQIPKTFKKYRYNKMVNALEKKPENIKKE